MSQILTEDVVIGLRGGDMWRGFEGLREYLSVRAEFFDQRTELKAVLSLTMLSDLDLEITSRLDFFMRRWRSNCQYLWIGVFQATSVSVC